MSFLASAHATLSPLDLLSRSAERMAAGRPSVWTHYLSRRNQSLMLMGSRVVHASFARGCAAPGAGCDMLKGTNRYLAARQFLGPVSLVGPEGLTALTTPPHIYKSGRREPNQRSLGHAQLRNLCFPKALPLPVSSSSGCTALSICSRNSQAAQHSMDISLVGSRRLVQ